MKTIKVKLNILIISILLCLPTISWALSGGCSAEEISKVKKMNIADYYGIYKIVGYKSDTSLDYSKIYQSDKKNRLFVISKSLFLVLENGKVEDITQVDNPRYKIECYSEVEGDVGPRFMRSWNDPDLYDKPFINIVVSEHRGKQDRYILEIKNNGELWDSSSSIDYTSYIYKKID